MSLTTAPEPNVEYLKTDPDLPPVGVIDKTPISTTARVVFLVLGLVGAGGIGFPRGHILHDYLESRVMPTIVGPVGRGDLQYTVLWKTAQRLTFHLLQQPPDQVVRLAAALQVAAERVRPCDTCGNLTETALCAICADPRREPTLLCVVEEPSAVGVVDRATGFRGRYHVLMGRIKPVKPISPKRLLSIARFSKPQRICSPVMTLPLP